jgi:hypothetical protein
MEGPPFGKKVFNDPRREFPRFRARPLHNISLNLNGQPSNFHVANISIGGLGILVEGSDHPIGQAFDATLRIGKESFSIRLLERYKNSSFMGCQFENPTPELRAAIERYFEVEVLATRLSRVETNQGERANKVIFFHGKNNCELLINERDDQISYFNVIVLGNSIEVIPEKGVAVGVRIDDGLLPKREGVSLFKPLPHNDYLIDVANRFIENIEQLPKVYKMKLLAMLEHVSE